jgi:hypothetical protein
MATLPKQLTHKFFPGLGEQHEVGLQNVGYSAVDFTMTGSSAMTAAEIIASAPNTGAGDAHQVVVHSLGTEPGAVFVQLRWSGDADVGFITADNSAVYLKPTVSSAELGLAARVIAIR